MVDHPPFPLDLASTYYFPFTDMKPKVCTARETISWHDPLKSRPKSFFLFSSVLALSSQGKPKFRAQLSLLSEINKMQKRHGASKLIQNNPRSDTQARAAIGLRAFDNCSCRFVKNISRENMNAQRDTSAHAVS